MFRHRVIALVAASLSVSAAAVGLPSPAHAHSTGSDPASHTSQHKPAGSTPPVRHLAAYVDGRNITVDWANPDHGFGKVVARYRRGSRTPTAVSGRRLHLAGAKASSATLRHLAPDTEYTVAVRTIRGSHRSAIRTTSFTTDQRQVGTGTYIGSVTDTSGNPLAGAAVQILNFSAGVDVAARSNASGRFTVVLPAGRYAALVDGAAATGGTADSTGYVGGYDVVRLRSGHTVRPAAVVLRAGALLTGQVTDTDGQPVSGVSVYTQVPSPFVGTDAGGIGISFGVEFDTGARGGVTAADGSFSLRGMPMMPQRVCVDPTAQATVGGFPLGGSFTVQCSPQTVDPRPRSTTAVTTPELDVRSGGALSGTIRGAGSGPVAGAIVEAFERNGASGGLTQTAEDGTYRIGSLAAGSYAVCVDVLAGSDGTRSGFQSSCDVHVAVTRDNETNFSTTLRRGAAVTGTVTDERGRPVVGASVSSRPASSYAVTDAAGQYTLGGMGGLGALGEPGGRAYRVCVAASGAAVPRGETGSRGGCLPTKLKITPGKVRTGADLTLRPGGAISGRVVDDSGKPVRNVEVDVEEVGKLSVSGDSETDRHGHYRLGGLPNGTYEVCFFASDDSGSATGSCAHRTTVRVGHVTRNVDEKLPAGATVTVRTENAAARPGGAVDVVLLKQCHSRFLGECDRFAAFGTRRVQVAQSAMTDASGSVTFHYVKPARYAVCALGFFGSSPDGTPATGYADRCDASFGVHATAGKAYSLTRRISDGAAITGRVTDSAGHPLRGATVHVSRSAADDAMSDDDFDENDGSQPIDYSRTDSHGVYTVRGITPGASHVCVDAGTARGGDSHAGYLDQCVGGPAGKRGGGTTVVTTADQTRSVADLSLTSGAGISGTVSWARPKGHWATADVFTTAGKLVGSADARHSGDYRAVSLPAGSLVVCFEDFRDGRCYRNASWNGSKLPPHATPVSTTAGAVTSGIDVTLHR